MKKYKYYKLLSVATLSLSMMLYACEDSFLETQSQGELTEDQVANERGVEALLISTYAMLDGQTGPAGVALFGPSATNWIFGSVASDDAAKGSDPADQAPINPIERFEADATNNYFNEKWRSMYEGVARANNTLKILALVEDMDDATRTRITGEARFLRGHYHFELKKMWNNVPYIDETVVYGEGESNIGNDGNIWPQIEADFQFAYNNLESSGMAVGRANKWAAGSYLAKTLMFQKRFPEALPLLETIIDQGETPLGIKYALMDEYGKNFNAEFKNGSESVFALQASVNDGGGGANANFAEVLNYPHNAGAPGGCCGFFQPTFDLVNAHRTDANGLPLLDTYNNFPVENDQGLEGDDPFTPDAGNLDPRLDWSVGRRGIPYLDWGLHPGQPWIREQPYGGPYAPKKMVFYKAQSGTLSDISFWTPGLSAVNFNIIRFADVLLWAAEAAAETDDMGTALKYVNMVRARAANPAGFVKNEDGTPAANYVINPYTSFGSKVDALEAIRFERRIEFAMEGHRRFDLVRWEIAAPVLNEFLDFESQFRGYLGGAEFEAGEDEYFPIPQRQIDLQTFGGESALEQNPGY